ncbi:MAG: Nmad5 family putative nucleotide modification protein [Pseudomonadota bacterium]
MRLTNKLRDQILKDLINHKFAAEDAQLFAVENQIGDDIYADFYGPAIIKKMDDMPDGALPRADMARVNIAGFNLNISMSKLRPIFHTDKRGHEVFNAGRTYPRDHEIAKRWTALENRRSVLSADKRDAKAQAGAVLYSAGTVKRLLEIWPEVKPFIPAEPPQAQLPVIITADLNKALGLPVDAAA